MKKQPFWAVAVCLLPTLFVAACQSASKDENAVSAYLACSGGCGPAALAVKDQFLKAPKETLDGFYKSVAQDSGDDFGRWLGDLSRSYFATDGEMTEEQSATLQSLIAAAQPLAADSQLGSYAERMLSELGALAAPAGPGVSVTGTYAYELPNDGGTGQLLISQLDNEALRYNLTVVGGPPAHNQGTAEGEAWFGPGNTATIVLGEEPAPCEIQLRFTGESVEAKTLRGNPADCGFGNGVLADGKYQRTSSADPFLPSGAEISSNLLGEWVSTDDPKSALMIDGGQYVEIYDGKEMGRFGYEFFPACPEQCSSIEGMSCFMVKGEMDATCYAVVKATEEALEISLVGGKGNTLTYRRK